MRLIDGDKLLDALGIFNDRKHGNEHFLNGIETAREIIENAPAIDAVPVVRCKDCTYRDDPHKSTEYLPCTEMRTAPNWFCASGKRRG